MDAASLGRDLGRFGVWAGGPVTPAQAVEIEALGYGAVWVGGSPDAELTFVEPILEATGSLALATGIVNIWKSDAATVARSFHRIEGTHPGRFLLGIGVGHPEATDRYAKPYDTLVAYLDALDAAAVPPQARIVAALGPRVLQLAAERSAGAHPYLTTPEHTAQARGTIGPTAFLAPEHKVVLTTDAAEARAIGRKTVGFYLGLRNYVENWRRLGFSEADVARPGSDALVDGVVAYGTAAEIAARLHEHLAAGADHVAVQVLGGPEALLPTLGALAGPLGLTPAR